MILSIIALAFGVVGAGLSVYMFASRKKNKDVIMKALNAADHERKKREDIEETLVEILDVDGEIKGKLYLPGEVMPESPIKTPCGKLCVHAYWKDFPPDNKGGWRCNAYLGYACLEARKFFVDKDNECTMFKRNKI